MAQKFWLSALAIILLSNTFRVTALAAEEKVNDPVGTQAQDAEAKIYPIPPSPDFPGAFGQDHYYSVIFRGNGEAVVTFKQIFTNATDSPLKTINLRLPRVDPKDMVFYQVQRQPICIRYKPRPYDQLRGYSPQICEEYQEPNYYDWWSSSTKYFKASARTEGDTIVLTLPKEVKPQASGSIIAYFRAIGFVKRVFPGSFEYSFETLKVDSAIRELQVGISTDTDLFLKEAQGKVDYRLQVPMAALESMTKGADSIASSQFDSYYQQIGQGSVIKKASGLQPMESYIIKGQYADTVIKLYARELLTVAAVILAIVVLVIMLVRLFISKLKSSQRKQEATALKVPAQIFGALETALASFIASILILGYSIFLYYLIQNLNRVMPSGPSFVPGTVLILGIVSLAVYLFIILASSFMVGIRKGWMWGAGTLILTIFWLLFYALFFFMFFMAFRRYPYIIQPMRATLQSVGQSEPAYTPKNNQINE